MRQTTCVKPMSKSHFFSNVEATILVQGILDFRCKVSILMIFWLSAVDVQMIQNLYEQVFENT